MATAKTIPPSLEGLATTATVEDIDDCLKSLDIYNDKALIDFWLDLRLLVTHNKKKEVTHA
jgi:hypothetical protein